MRPEKKKKNLRAIFLGSSAWLGEDGAAELGPACSSATGGASGELSQWTEEGRDVGAGGWGSAALRGGWRSPVHTGEEEKGNGKKSGSDGAHLRKWCHLSGIAPGARNAPNSFIFTIKK